MMKSYYSLEARAKEIYLDMFGDDLESESLEVIEEAYFKAVSYKDFAAELEFIEEEGKISLGERDAFLAAIN